MLFLLLIVFAALFEGRAMIQNRCDSSKLLQLLFSSVICYGSTIDANVSCKKILLPKVNSFYSLDIYSCLRNCSNFAVGAYLFVYKSITNASYIVHGLSLCNGSCLSRVTQFTEVNCSSSTNVSFLSRVPLEEFDLSTARNGTAVTETFAANVTAHVLISAKATPTCSESEGAVEHCCHAQCYLRVLFNGSRHNSDVATYWSIIEQTLKRRYKSNDCFNLRQLCTDTDSLSFSYNAKYTCNVSSAFMCKESCGQMNLTAKVNCSSSLNSIFCKVLLCATSVTEAICRSVHHQTSFGKVITNPSTDRTNPSLPLAVLDIAAMFLSLLTLLFLFICRCAGL